MAQMFDDRDIALKGHYLAQKKIDFVVTGGVASVESARFIRELRRYGAEVRVWMTPSAEKFVSPLVFEWASKQVVITELSGSAQHISSSDAVVVAPCTLNFLSKVALGIADTAAATLIQSALGRLPLFIAPSMHSSLADVPAYQRQRKSLSMTPLVHFLEPESSESKLKMISVESAVAAVCHALQAQTFSSVPKMVIAFGPTRSAIDDVRYVSNHSTGALGLQIAEEFFRRGFDVTAIAGPIQLPVPSFLKTISVKTNSEMKKAMSDVVKRGADIAIFCAAILDFEVVKTIRGKLSSRSAFDIALKPSPKLIESINAPKLFKVGFKLEAGVSEKVLLQRAQEAIQKQKVELLVANRLEDVSSSAHRALLLAKGSAAAVRLNSRQEIAQALAVHFESKLKSHFRRKSSRRA